MLTVDQAIERARSAPCDSAAEMSRAGFRNAAFVLADEVERLQGLLLEKSDNCFADVYSSEVVLPGKDGGS